MQHRWLGEMDPYRDQPPNFKFRTLFAQLAERGVIALSGLGQAKAQGIGKARAAELWEHSAGRLSELFVRTRRTPPLNQRLVGLTRPCSCRHRSRK